MPKPRSLLYAAVAAAALFLGARPAHAQQAQASLSSSATTALTQSSTMSGMSTITLPAPTTIPFSSSTTTTTAASSSEAPAPTANTTTSTQQQVRLWPPKGGLVMCQRVEFAFTGPAVPKSCGVYVTNTSTYLQQIPLGGEFTSLTGGTFPWLVDLPAGLSVEVQFWVSINNRVEQFTLRNLVVQPSADSSCIATGPSQNTQSIVSYASSLNSSPTSAAAQRSGDENNAGPIAGGVVGGLAALALLGLTIYLCLRRRRRARSVQPPLFFGDHNADKGSPPMTHAQMVALNYQGYPSAGGTGAAPTPEESSNHSPVASKPSGQIPPVPYVSQKELQRAPPNATAPGSVSSSVSPPSGEEVGTASSPTTAPSQRGHEGTRGLDDPATFSPRHR
ncbi:hypothetical protein C6P46_003499 [Rhodotorula mucilaginosa]|uniref:Uncharacterized protein n=1 Tax=Rhodotorula mucilaginosa TaxID=5537 RepID=A0A9P6W463_RHOMI|nr:hypothetical protein C6P46_003499 [Rhodotorula mucilaginosa]